LKRIEYFLENTLGILWLSPVKDVYLMYLFEERDTRRDSSIIITYITKFNVENKYSWDQHKIMQEVFFRLYANTL